MSMARSRLKFRFRRISRAWSLSVMKMWDGYLVGRDAQSESLTGVEVSAQRRMKRWLLVNSVLLAYDGRPEDREVLARVL